MKKIIAVAAFFWLLAAWAGAAVFQDWSDVKMKENVGTFADSNGSKLTLSQSAGPASGEKALQISADLVQWGGVWALIKTDLSSEGALKFQAKASQPGILRIGLTDDRHVQKVADIRITSDAWQEFTVPLSLFVPTKYPDPKAPKNAKLNLAKVGCMQFQPQGQGVMKIWVGPLSSVAGKTAARTGMPEVTGDRLMVQDFTLLGKNACGPFVDKESGSKIELQVAKDPDAGGDGWVGAFKCDLRACGWGGYWMRAGDTWEGQNWRVGKTFSFRVYSEEPIVLSFGFTDVNQNAYSANAPKTRGKGWETLSFPMSAFKLSEYYQPEGAKEGAPLDLSKIEAFTVSPITKGHYVFKLKDVEIIKK